MLPSTYEFLVTANQFVLNPMFARMLVGLDISAARERAILPDVKHFRLSYYNSKAPSSNVEVKNIGSSGCADLIQ